MRLFHVIDQKYYPLWAEAPIKTIREKQHGYKIILDLSDWSQRLSYFLGRYHDDSLQALMSRCLVSGDRFVDVGTNIGLVTLFGARLVGKEGQVDGFEPNPTCFETVKKCLDINQIENVRLHNLALSETRGNAVLSIHSFSNGSATLASVKADSRLHIKETVAVHTEVGDDVLAADPRPIKLIKIDVEGYEHSVLKGLKKTLAEFKPIVVTEVIEGQLNAAGSGRKQLVSFFQELGYRPYGLGSYKIGRRIHLRLDEIGNEVVEAPHLDFVWIHPGSTAAATLMVEHAEIDGLSR
jgi:FkbM family methyltransferase